MSQLIDCPECACLIAADESACPFCGATQRRAAMPAMLSIGFMLGLASASCGDKGGGTASTTTVGDTTTSTGTGDETVNPTEMQGGTAYAGPPTDSGFETGTTFASSVAYAGPPSSSSEPPTTETETETDTDTSSGTGTGTETETGTGTETDTGTTTTGTTEMGGTTAYAGPDSTTGTTG